MAERPQTPQDHEAQPEDEEACEAIDDQIACPVVEHDSNLDYSIEKSTPFSLKPPKAVHFRRHRVHQGLRLPTLPPHEEEDGRNNSPYSSSDEHDQPSASPNQHGQSIKLRRISKIVRRQSRRRIHAYARPPRDRQQEHGVNGQNGTAKKSTNAIRREIDRHRFLSGKRETKFAHRIRRTWRRHVSRVVDRSHTRDHLALERTFLGYLRTSLALSQIGVLTAQLFRLSDDAGEFPNQVVGYQLIAKPLAATLICAAILVALVGATRFWRQQDAIERGAVLVGGWEIYFMMGGMMAMAVVLLLCLVIGKDG